MKKNTSYAKALLVLFISLIGLLVFNIGYLALTGKHLLSNKSIFEHAYSVRDVTTEIVKSNRGNIYSYDGDLLVTDRVSYIPVAFIDSRRQGYGTTPAYVDKPELAAQILSKYVNMTADEILDIFLNSGRFQWEFKAYLSNSEKEALQKELANDSGFVRTEGMDDDDVEKELDKLKVHGIEFIKTTSRNYAYNHFCSYLLGFVKVNDDDPYSITRTGMQGVEAAYNDLLDGKDGEKVYQADTLGRAIYHARISETEAVNGADIYLSLDSEIQNMLEVQLDNAMRETHADKMWFGIMDAKTGRVMAMASRPDYDLKDPVFVNYYDLYLDELYEVGSVVKPFVYLAAMEAGKYDGNETYQSGLAYVEDSPGQEPIQDFNYGIGWGVIPYDEGLIHSSNTAIVHLVQDKKIINDVIATYEKLGFFQSKTIDNIQAKLGLPESDYQITTAQGWYQYATTDAPYDKVTMCFGQSSNYTPFDLLRAYSIFANDGKIVEPYLVDHIIDSNGQTIYSATRQESEQLFDKTNIDHIKKLLIEVVNNDDIGTGTVYKSNDFKIFGKTGTGDLFDEHGKNVYKSYYSFAGGAPADDPQVIFFIGCQGYKEYLPQESMNNVVQSIVSQALAKLNTNVITGQDVAYKDTVVPGLVNQSVEFSKKQLGQLGLSYQLIGQGSVIKAQYPLPDADISSAKKIFLLTDDTSYLLPDFTGWSRQDIATYFHFFDVNVTFFGNGKCTKQSVGAGTEISSVTDISIELK